MPSFRFASATGSGSSLIVTCSDQFAGKTITCTNGTKTYTRTCPSTSPYEVVFKGVAPGTWTVSGVVEGTTYSQQVVITDFDVTLTAGFNYTEWVTLGGLDPTDYASLSEVFADEVAVRRLMTIHASADYLIEKVTDDVDAIDDFVANDTAMKWIGLRDYVCDGLTAIAGVEAKFMASQYWERYLKDHVPVMTSNTAPYGTVTASASASATSYPFYAAFDGSESSSWRASGTTVWIAYQFANPICVKKIHISEVGDSGYTAKVQGSNDNSTWTDLLSIPFTGQTEIDEEVENDDYYLYYRVYTTSTSSIAMRFIALQFYGRSLDVSIPAMTSNTAPYGEAFASSIIGDGRIAYCAFNNVYSTGSAGSNIWHSLAGSPQFVGYKSTSAYCVKYARLRTSSDHKGPKVAKLQGSNDSTNGTDGTWTDIGDFVDCPNTATWYFKQYDSNDNSYLWYRLYVTEANIAYTVVDELQLYGINYSEREFAEGSTMKYLYDHGVELETLDSAYTSSTTVDAPTKEDTQIYFATDGSNIRVIGTTNKLDLTDYSFLRMTDGDKGVLGSSSFGGLQVLNAKNTSSGVTSQLSLTTMSASTGNQILNVSSLNTEYYVAVYSSNASRQYSFTELWLE